MGKFSIDTAIQRVLDKGDKAFVPYIMAGDGGLDQLNHKFNYWPTQELPSLS